MSSRPAIPEDLRRRILVEAGHRCAIHTCRHPDVDVHHIVPWETCKDHAYDNLIALCPNCHRRAGSGEIDRKSLRMYKAKLAAGIITTEAPALVAGGTHDQPSEWRTLRVASSEADVTGGAFEIEIPQFLAGDLEELNRVEYGWAAEKLLEFRNVCVNSQAINFHDGLDGPPGYISGNFEVITLSSGLVSVRYALSEYYRGAAHPNTSFRTVNARRDPLFLLRFSDLFAENSDYLERVSALAMRQLGGGASAGDEWLKDGAGPRLENFSLFNLSDAGILVTFPPYAVSGYASGPQYVTIPWSAVRDITSPLLWR
jgi:hypothetical protein